MNDSPRSGSLFCAVITLLGITLVLLPLGTQGFAQSQEDHPSWLRALDSLSTERMLADVRTLSGPAFNGRQAGSEDDLRSAQWFAQELTSVGVNATAHLQHPTHFPISHNKERTYLSASWPRWSPPHSSRRTPSFAPAQQIRLSQRN